MDTNNLIKNRNDILRISFLQKLNILSLDVVLGVLAGGVFVVQIFNVVPGFAWWVVLPISVWILYTLDHLIDAYKLKQNSHTLRHTFHYYYSLQLIISIILLSLINIFIIIFYLEKQIIYFGVIAGVCSLIYLLFVYLLRNTKTVFLQKEFFVAVIYTIGIWGGPAALVGYNLCSPQIIFLVVFFLVAFADILIFSFFEVETDRIDNHSSFAIRFGTKPTKILIYILIATVFALCICQFIFQASSEIIIASKIFMLMGLILLAMLSYPVFFKKNGMYRFIGEVVFWLPGLALLI